MVKIVCQKCSQAFEVRQYRSMTAKYCSVKCRSDAARGVPVKGSVPGYRRIKTDGKPRLAHRYLTEKAIGRTLDRLEQVHHKNEIKCDNRAENLEVMTPKAHSMHHNQKHAITKTCTVCGAEFTPHPTKRARAKCCSKTCASKYLSLQFRKPDAPNSMYREGAYPCQVLKRI